jgi:hypothetical protein
MRSLSSTIPIGGWSGQTIWAKCVVCMGWIRCLPHPRYDRRGPEGRRRASSFQCRAHRARPSHEPSAAGCVQRTDRFVQAGVGAWHAPGGGTAAGLEIARKSTPPPNEAPGVSVRRLASSGSHPCCAEDASEDVPVMPRRPRSQGPRSRARWACEQTRDDRETSWGSRQSVAGKCMSSTGVDHRSTSPCRKQEKANEVKGL